MAFGKPKLMLSIGFFGFLLGTAAYFAFNWFATNNMIIVTSVPIADVIFAPWFISGIAGSILSIIIVSLFGRFSSEA